MKQEKIGEFIRQRRKELDLTQLELAEKIGITDRAISKWERGKGMPDISLLIPLSNELKVTVLELLNGEIIKDENKAIVSIIKNNNKKIKTWKYLFLGIINIILIIMIFILSTCYFIPNKYINNNNQGILKVSSNSMSPILKVGDTIIYDKISIDNVKENDLVVYYFTDSNNEIINNIKTIHRVKKIINENNNINLITKGDNNIETDKNHVNNNNYLGIYNHKLPSIISIFVKDNIVISNKIVTLLIIAIISILYLDVLQLHK